MKKKKGKKIVEGSEIRKKKGNPAGKSCPPAIGSPLATVNVIVPKLQRLKRRSDFCAHTFKRFGGRNENVVQFEQNVPPTSLTFDVLLYFEITRIKIAARGMMGNDLFLVHLFSGPE